MDYERKYIKALEWMRSLYSGLHGATKEEAEHYFPELKEREDERIREAIIRILKGEAGYTSKEDTDKYVTWLEKQRQKPKKVSIWKHWKNGIAGNGEGRLIYLTKVGNTYNLSSVLSCECDYIQLSDLDNLMLEKQGEPEDKGEISDGYHTFNELYEYRKLYNAAFFNLLPKELVHKSKKHHDGEECFGGGWFIVMANLPTGQISNHYELKDWDLFQIPEKDVADEWDGHTPQEAVDRLHRYLLEKQGEKKSINKVEPKFKVGDFIANDYCSGKVIEITNDAYLLDTGQGIPFSCEHNAHLWSINDAKDGDVLIKEETEEPFIYNGNRGSYLPEFVGGYCGICDGKFKPNGSTCYWGRPACPSTKEQCDTLFAKMKEAGYEWDADKKELKKIELKTLYADKVIAWLVANICDFEHYVTLFKKDFGL